MSPYEQIPHTADLGVVIRGSTLEDLFIEAARALFDLLIRPAAPRAPITRTLTVEGTDLEDLMVNWLRELLYLYNGEEQAVTGVTVLCLTPRFIEAAVDLTAVDFEADELGEEIKAVTYHQIRVKKTEHGFEAQVIFDV